MLIAPKDRFFQTPMEPISRVSLSIYFSFYLHHSLLSLSLWLILSDFLWKLTKSIFGVTDGCDVGVFVIMVYLNGIYSKNIVRK